MMEATQAAAYDESASCLDVVHVWVKISTPSGEKRRQ